MWFARKPKNRAFERRHVLDVKVARREVRRMRARVATMAAGLSIGTVFVVYIAWRCGSAALDHFVYKNSAFAIQRIDLETDGVLSHEQIRQWAAIRKNDNLFALDLTRVKRTLELVPVIESASVERILPNAIRLRVIEREPIARAQEGLIDRHGFLMLPLGPHQRSMPAPSVDHYPAIVGYNSAEVRFGRETESPQIRAALQFIAAFETSPMAALVDIAKIDVSHPDVLQVTTLQQNQITFRNVDFEKQLNRWWLVHKKGMELSRQIATLDLSVADYLPLRWFDVAAVPPAPTKVRKGSPYKKKHV
jgi:cell division septal protein FtsQ